MKSGVLCALVVGVVLLGKPAATMAQCKTYGGGPGPTAERGVKSSSTPESAKKEIAERGTALDFFVGEWEASAWELDDRGVKREHKPWRYTCTRISSSMVRCDHAGSSGSSFYSYDDLCGTYRFASLVAENGFMGVATMQRQGENWIYEFDTGDVIKTTITPTPDGAKELLQRVSDGQRHGEVVARRLKK